MAVDSRQKRASVVGEFSFWETHPLADSNGADTVADRGHLVWTYSGIAPSLDEPDITVALADRTRHVALTARSRHATLGDRTRHVTLTDRVD